MVLRIPRSLTLCNHCQGGMSGWKFHPQGIYLPTKLYPKMQWDPSIRSMSSAPSSIWPGSRRSSPFRLRPQRAWPLSLQDYEVHQLAIPSPVGPST